MSDKLKSVTVGIVALLAIFLLYFLINYLKGVNIMNSKRTFHAYYQDISGLTEGNSVTIQGYKVGTVTQIYFDEERDNHLKVVMNIENDIQIPINSEVKIVSLDLMGTKGISLYRGDSDVMANSGSELNSGKEKEPMEILQKEISTNLLPLNNKIRELIDSVNSVMTVFTTVLNKDARASLSNSFISLKETFTTLSETMLVVDQIVNENKENVSHMIANVASISDNLNTSNVEIKKFINNLSTLSDTLVSADIPSTLTKIDKIINKINNSEGSLGLLINDKELYNSLKDTSKVLEQLMKDIEEKGLLKILKK